MRCYIKEHYYIQIGGELPVNKLYQKEIWEFTGRIKYQRDEDGDMVICFEVIMLENENEDENKPLWYSDYWFDFDYSDEAVIYDCNKE